jgi:hypothetical protein
MAAKMPKRRGIRRVHAAKEENSSQPKVSDPDALQPASKGISNPTQQIITRDMIRRCSEAKADEQQRAVEQQYTVVRKARHEEDGKDKS